MISFRWEPSTIKPYGESCFATLLGGSEREIAVIWPKKAIWKAQMLGEDRKRFGEKHKANSRESAIATVENTLRIAFSIVAADEQLEQAGMSLELRQDVIAQLQTLGEPVGLNLARVCPCPDCATVN